MKKISIIIAVALLGWAVPTQAQVFQNFQDSLSYAIGISIGKNFARDLAPAGVTINEQVFLQGMHEANAPKYTDEQLNQIFQRLQMVMQKGQMDKIQKEGATNLKTGQDFLTKNKGEAGVKTTASGLQYKPVKTVASGKQPTAASTVKVHYRGTLINGEEFDSSYKRGEPAEFPLAGVIKGWTEGLQLMKEGEKFMFYIPADLAYGQQAPPSIGPNQTLIFEVELLEVK